MELKEVYAAMDGDYEDVVRRLRKEERIVKFLLKFRDRNPMEPLLAALEQEKYEEAFREAHNMKGVCANLSLNGLGVPAQELTERLRGGRPEDDITPLVEAVRSAYAVTMTALEQL